MDHFEELARAVCASWGIVPDEGTGLYIDGVEQRQWQDEEVLRHVQSFRALSSVPADALALHVAASSPPEGMPADRTAEPDRWDLEQINRIADAIHIALGWGESDPLKEPHTWRQAQFAAVAARKAGGFPCRPGYTHVATVPPGLGHVTALTVRDGRIVATTASGVDLVLGVMGQR